LPGEFAVAELFVFVLIVAAALPLGFYKKVNKDVMKILINPNFKTPMYFPYNRGNIRTLKNPNYPPVTGG
jgi:hypothetical protein